MAGFDRGFKSWAERTALAFRRTFELRSSDPLDTLQLSKHLDVKLITPNDVTGLPANCLQQLLVIDKDGWSAVTLSKSDKHTVIYNPRHSEGRRSSDIMHELSHLIIGHEPSKLILSPDGGTVLRSHDPKQEDEASWLAGCLLLPREALVHIIRVRMPDPVVCSSYKVSNDLLRYRLNITGVTYQMRKYARVAS